MSEIRFEFCPTDQSDSNFGLIGDFSLLQDEATFFNKNGELIDCLSRPKVIFITHVGIRVSGFEQSGSEKCGLPKYMYREWFLKFKLDE